MTGQRATLSALREWQSEAAPFQLHPGDVGWFGRFGPEATAAALRTWTRDGRLLAVGLLDSPGLLRLTIAPDAYRDERLAREILDPTPEKRIESPRGALLKDLLSDAGWTPAEPWTPLKRDLAHPVPDAGVRIEVVTAERAPVRVAVQRAAFANSTFTDERWHAMAAGLPYAEARCLVAFDDHDEAVAAVTVWSAGPGRPGLLEPMGVHSGHRGHGYGTAITVAAAAALRDLGASSAVVCTQSSNVGGVATYTSAGFEPLPEVCDQALVPEPGP